MHGAVAPAAAAAAAQGCKQQAGHSRLTYLQPQLDHSLLVALRAARLVLQPLPEALVAKDVAALERCWPVAALLTQQVQADGASASGLAVPSCSWLCCCV